MNEKMSFEVFVVSIKKWGNFFSPTLATSKRPSKLENALAHVDTSVSACALAHFQLIKLTC